MSKYSDIKKEVEEYHILLNEMKEFYTKELDNIFISDEEYNEYNKIVKVIDIIQSMSPEKRNMIYLRMLVGRHPKRILEIFNEGDSDKYKNERTLSSIISRCFKEIKNKYYG